MWGNWGCFNRLLAQEKKIKNNVKKYKSERNFNKNTKKREIFIAKKVR